MKWLVLLLSACARQEEALSNWNFNFWQEGQPVGWEVERGAVERVGTWHARDYGASLVGDDVALSQLIDGATACMRVQALTDLAPDVDVRFEVDAGDDGHPETVQQIPRVPWQEITFTVQLPATDVPVRFRVVKRGVGHAVVANLRGRSCVESHGEL